jgi:hypothetical protein
MSCGVAGLSQFHFAPNKFSAAVRTMTISAIGVTVTAVLESAIGPPTESGPDNCTNMLEKCLTATCGRANAKKTPGSMLDIRCLTVRTHEAVERLSHVSHQSCFTSVERQIPASLDVRFI